MNDSASTPSEHDRPTERSGRATGIRGKARAVAVAIGLLVAGLAVSILFAVGGSYARRAGGVSVRVPTRRELAYAGGGLLAALVLVIVVSILATLLGVAPSESVFEDPIAQDPTVALGLAALSIVLVAPAEELLFRGAIQGRLRRSFGPAGAIAIASLIFGGIHLANYSGSVAGTVVGVGIVTVGGAIFGIIYERTDNLVVPILSHGAYNTVLLVGAFLAA